MYNILQNYGSCIVRKPSSYWGLIILSHSHLTATGDLCLYDQPCTSGAQKLKLAQVQCDELNELNELFVLLTRANPSRLARMQHIIIIVIIWQIATNYSTWLRSICTVHLLTNTCTKEVWWCKNGSVRRIPPHATFKNTFEDVQSDATRGIQCGRL